VVDESILTIVQKYLRNLRLHGFDVRFGVIFGSQVKGRADDWSDIDLLVVSPRFDQARNRKDVDLLWRLAARTDNRIEPLPCGEEQWNKDVSHPIIEISRREGQRVLI